MESTAKGVVGRYNQFVLEGAWIDERSTLPPSIVADQGYRLYTSQNKDVYGKAPDLSQELTYPRFRPRYGMLTAATWNEASYSYGGGPNALKAVLLNGKKAFNATHGGKDMTKEEISATFTTTARQAAISGIQVSAASAVQAAANTATLARTSLIPAAGGRAFLSATDRGKAITGVSGEVIRESADSRYDTQAQRSWTGRPDAGLGVSRKVRARPCRVRAPGPPPQPHARTPLTLHAHYCTTTHPPPPPPTACRRRRRGPRSPG
jgi:hypothetical protein